MTDWQVIVLDNRFPGMSARLAIYRNSIAGGRQVVGADGTVHLVRSEGAQQEEIPLPEVPWECLDALRAAIDEHLGRRHDQQVVDEIRAALEHERGRVDDVLFRFLDAMTTTKEQHP